MYRVLVFAVAAVTALSLLVSATNTYAGQTGTTPDPDRVVISAPR